MSITFDNEADIIVWTLAKVLVIVEQRQYLFTAQCIWWIAALVPLDPALRYIIDNQKFPSECHKGDQIPELVLEVPKEISLLHHVIFSVDPFPKKARTQLRFSMKQIH